MEKTGGQPVKVPWEERERQCHWRRVCRQLQLPPVSSVVVPVLILLWLASSVDAVNTNDETLIGLNWGRIAIKPLDNEVTVGLMQRNNVTHVKIFQATYRMLDSLKHSGIKVAVGTTLTALKKFAKYPETVDLFVRKKILYWQKKGVDFNIMFLGNEPFLDGVEYASDLIKAMRTFYTVFQKYDLSHIKISTPLSFPVETTKPASSASFGNSELQHAMHELCFFLWETNSTFYVNPYPFIAAYRGNGAGLEESGRLGFFLGEKDATQGYVDPVTNLTYTRLLDVMMDSVIGALANLGFPHLSVGIGETGWPTSGGLYTSANNSQQYLRNVLDFATSGRGTPLRPGVKFPVYLFALLDEDDKSGSYEKHWGLFNGKGRPLVQVDFTGQNRSDIKAVEAPSGPCKWAKPVAKFGELPSSATKCTDKPKAEKYIPFYIVIGVYMLSSIPGVLLFPFAKLKQRLALTRSRLLRWFLFPGVPATFVGRGLYENFWRTTGYSLFWVFLLAGKSTFSYWVEIYPAVVESTHLIDNSEDLDYEFLPIFKSKSAIVGALLTTWIPIVMLFILDLQVIFTLFGGVLGVLEGFRQRLGIIRSVKTMKERFYILPRLMVYHLHPEKGLLESRGASMHQMPERQREAAHDDDHAEAPVSDDARSEDGADEIVRRDGRNSKSARLTKSPSLPPTSPRFSRMFTSTGLPTVRYGSGGRDPAPSRVAKSVPLINRSWTLARFGATMAHHIAEIPAAAAETNKSTALIFSQLWNEIVESLRQEDLVTNREHDVMLMPRWNNRLMVPQWPLFLLAGSLKEMGIVLEGIQLGRVERTGALVALASDTPTVLALTEARQLLGLLLQDLTAEGSEERNAIELIFQLLDEVITDPWVVLATFNAKQLHPLFSYVVALSQALASPVPPAEASAQRHTVATKLQEIYALVVQRTVKQEAFAARGRTALIQQSWRDDLFCSAHIVYPPEDNQAEFHSQAHRLHQLLTLDPSAGDVGTNPECARRLVFFANSLHMDMPEAPRVAEMIPFSTLTPYYHEDVIYSQQHLQTENKEGVSVLFYLQKLYPDEWTNFLDRVGVSTEDEAWHVDEGWALRLWASYRAQTLARTVRGMMYYHRVLALQHFLDQATEEDLVEDKWSDPGVSAYARAVADLKYTYVVTCQSYGQQKKSKDPRAAEIFYLLQHNEALRVAYVDEVLQLQPDGRVDKEYFSVLVKGPPARAHAWGSAAGSSAVAEQEVYRVKLPGPAKVGEGKPENQNHAIIFTRGLGVQVIDMNQDNYLEEAMKMRNLLEEFEDVSRHGGARPRILGMREHVFSGSVASVAFFMFAEEVSLVTLWFRVLALLRVRLHYGHPDVFDRLWHIQRGGISKASPIMHVVEDVYGGMNTTVRGGTVTHHEYIQLGKGRDVGLFQISQFYSKVASGQGEETLSRDVHRLAHGFDFFRLLSFFFTHLGLTISLVLTMVNQYLLLYIHIFLTTSGMRQSIKDTYEEGTQAGLVYIVQLVIFAVTLFVQPTWLNWILELGFVQGTKQFALMMLLLGPVYFTFLLGVRIHNFTKTVMYGGAKYRATGRKFVIGHEAFDENYRRFSRSHYQIGLEFILLLILSYIYGKPNPVLEALTWFIAISFIYAPALFNPSGFEWYKNVEDWETYVRWMSRKGSIGIPPEVSWEAWWAEQQEGSKNPTVLQCLTDVLLAVRFFLPQYFIINVLDATATSFSARVDGRWYLVSWGILILVLFAMWAMEFARKKLDLNFHPVYRMVTGLVVVGMLGALAILIFKTPLTLKDMLGLFFAGVFTGWGIIMLAQAIRPVVVWLRLWPAVVSLAHLYDWASGTLIFAPILVLSWFPFFSTVQTRMLYNTAFSRGLEASRFIASSILRPNQAEKQ